MSGRVFPKTSKWGNPCPVSEAWGGWNKWGQSGEALERRHSSLLPGHSKWSASAGVPTTTIAASPRAQSNGSSWPRTTDQNPETVRQNKSFFLYIVSLGSLSQWWKALTNIVTKNGTKTLYLPPCYLKRWVRFLINLDVIIDLSPIWAFTFALNLPNLSPPPPQPKTPR